MKELKPKAELARYTAESGNEIILTPETIRNMISTDPNVTDQEIIAFAALCKAHGLDPFLKEAYLIKYGKGKATIVTGKEVFTKRAYRHPRFKGMEAGVTILTVDPQTGMQRLHRRDGSMAIAALGETIVGGWAKVYIDGYEHPVFDEVSFDEYAARRDGNLTGQWAKMPGTMIRKVAVVHALREAFPEEFQGLYDSVEMGVEEPAREVYSEYEPARVMGELDDYDAPVIEKVHSYCEPMMEAI